MSKNFLIKNGYKYEILIEKNDDFKEKSDFFLKKLEKEYIEFNERWKKFDEKTSNELKENVDFEILSKKSPTTIIDAPWGSGKTYFVEEFCKYFVSGKINSDVFKNVIKIDAWKFSNSKDIPDEIMAEIFLKLSNKLLDFKEHLFKFAKKTFNTTLVSWTNTFLFTDFEKINLKPNDYDNSLKKIKNIDPVIIFLDNIERLGKGSWDVMKAIQKMSILENFVFVLPMNVKKMKNNENLDDGEYPIEKYIDIKYFEFKQDYFGLLTSMGFDTDISKQLNKLFLYEIEGQNLSVRELEQRLNNSNILLNKNNVWPLYKEIYNNVWGSYEIAKENLVIYLKESNLLDALEEEYKIYSEFKNLVNNNYLRKFYNSVFMKYRFGFDIDYYELHWSDIYDEILSEIILIKKNLKKIKTDKTKNIKNISKIKENISKIKEQNERYNKSIIKEEENELPEQINITNLNHSINVNVSKINHETKKISILEKENLDFENTIQQLEEKKYWYLEKKDEIKNLNDSWNEAFSKYKKFDKEIIDSIIYLDSDEISSPISSFLISNNFDENEGRIVLEKIIEKILI